ncbi:hypothetical protein CLOP_g6901 [Closterium sp. NIES-67]|nr:hypothetical protein CLOP_g6901 [Closterium sp. NIES-67]
MAISAKPFRLTPPALLRLPSRALVLLIAAVHLMPWECRAAIHFESASDSASLAPQGLRGRRLVGTESDAVAPASSAASSGARVALSADQARGQASITGVTTTNRVDVKCALARSKFGAIYTFGDSLADVGNNNYGRGESFYRADFPPYGMNFIPLVAGSVTGNSSLTICRIISSCPPPCSLPPWHQRQCRPSRAQLRQLRAGVLDSTNAGKAFPLSSQLSRFSELGGLEAANQSPDPPLALVSIATNDYLVFLSKGINLGRWMDPREQIRLAEILPQAQELIASVVGGISNAVRTLHASGFRHFLVFDTLPIGCTPLASQPLLNRLAGIQTSQPPRSVILQ